MPAELGERGGGGPVDHEGHRLGGDLGGVHDEARRRIVDARRSCRDGGPRGAVRRCGTGSDAAGGRCSRPPRPAGGPIAASSCGSCPRPRRPRRRGTTRRSAPGRPRAPTRSRGSHAIRTWLRKEAIGNSFHHGCNEFSNVARGGVDGRARTSAVPRPQGRKCRRPRPGEAGGVVPPNDRGRSVRLVASREGGPGANKERLRPRTATGEAIAAVSRHTPRSSSRRPAGGRAAEVGQALSPPPAMPRRSMSELTWWSCSTGCRNGRSVCTW